MLLTYKKALQLKIFLIFGLQETMDELPAKEESFASTHFALEKLDDSNDLIDASCEKKLMEGLQKQFEFLKMKVPERRRILDEDIIKWEEYILKLEKMISWIADKRSCMKLEKPTDREGVEEQKQLLEVGLFPVVSAYALNLLKCWYKILLTYFSELNGFKKLSYFSINSALGLF